MVCYGFIIAPQSWRGSKFIAVTLMGGWWPVCAHIMSSGAKSTFFMQLHKKSHMLNRFARHLFWSMCYRAMRPWTLF